MNTRPDASAALAMKGAIARSLLALPRERLAALVGADAAGGGELDWCEHDGHGPLVEIDLERGVFAVEGHFRNLGAFVSGAVGADGARFTGGGVAPYDSASDYYVLADRFQDEAYAASASIGDGAPDVAAPAGWSYEPPRR